MKLTKRMLAALLTLCLLLTMAPAMALTSSAAGGQELTLIEAGSNWKYYYFADDEAVNEDLGLTWPAEYPEGWSAPGFDTTGWLTGGAPFTGPAYANASAKTKLNVSNANKLSAAFVQTFTMPDGFEPDELILSLFYDENPVVYLNGTQIFTRSGYNGSLSNFDVTEFASLLHGGTNTVAVEMINAVNGGGFNFDLKLVAKSGSTDLKLIKEKDEWEYFYFTTDADKNAELGIDWDSYPEGWYAPSFDRSDWLSGNGFFVGANWPKAGYSTKINVTQDYELHAGFAKTFTLTDASAVTSLTMGIMYDENPTVYLNGTPIFTASGFKDSNYVEVNLNSYKSLLVDGENVVTASMMNAVNGGGFLFAMTLTAGVEPLELYDASGKAIIDSASSNWAWASIDLGSANNIFDDDPGSCCGAFFTADNYIIANFRGDVELNYIEIESKAEGSTTDEGGIYGYYDIYALEQGTYVKIAENVPSYTTALGGEIIKLPETVTTSSLKIVVTSWQGDNWANVCELRAYKTLGTATVTFVADNAIVAKHVVAAGSKLPEQKLPAVPAKSGYSGIWDTEITTDTTISSDLTVTAVYTELRSFTVTFVADGTVVYEKTLLAGEVFTSAEYPAVPEKAYYTGAWDRSGDIVGADVTVTAVYTDTRTNLVTADNLASYVNGTPKSNPWGAIGQVSNVTDGDPSTVWGWGFESGMYLEATFDGYYEISRIYAECKQEGTPNEDGEYGLYRFAYLSQSGEWVTITEAAAKPVAAGGANLEFTPVIAKAVRLIPVEWYTTDWAGAAEWQVYGVASDAKDTYVITWTDGTTTVTTTVEDGAMPLPPAEIGSYTEGNIRYTLIGWEPAITAATEPTTYTAVFSAQDLSVLTMTVSGDGIYTGEDDEGEDVTVLAVKLAYYNGIWASDLFDEDYTWVFTVNGTPYEIAPVAVASATGKFTFWPCLADTPFVPQADTTYEISLAIYDGEEQLYHSGAIEITTDPDFEPITPEIPVVFGDVNADGTVSIEDVSALLALIAEGSTAEVADVDGDGAVSIRDVSKLLALLAE